MVVVYHVVCVGSKKIMASNGSSGEHSFICLLCIDCVGVGEKRHNKIHGKNTTRKLKILHHVDIVVQQLQRRSQMTNIP